MAAGLLLASVLMINFLSFLLATYTLAPATFDGSVYKGDVKAAICYLARSDRKSVNDLKLSLQLLYRNFLRSYPQYPVYLFYDQKKDSGFPDQFSDIHKAYIPLITVKFVPIENFNAETTAPQHIQQQIPEWVTWGSAKFSLGYRRMCHFWTKQFFEHQEILKLDYYWRLDTDSFIVYPLRRDLFKQMAAEQISFGLLVDDSEEAEGVVFGLYDLFKGLGTKYRWDMSLFNARTAVRNDETGESKFNLKIIYNNFEIARPSLFQTGTSSDDDRGNGSRVYAKIVDSIIHTGGIWIYRWGDAPIRTLSLPIMERNENPPLKMKKFEDIWYFHQVLSPPAYFKQWLSYGLWISIPVSLVLSYYIWLQSGSFKKLIVFLRTAISAARYRLLLAVVFLVICITLALEHIIYHLWLLRVLIAYLWELMNIILSAK